MDVDTHTHTRTHVHPHARTHAQKKIHGEGRNRTQIGHSRGGRLYHKASETVVRVRHASCDSHTVERTVPSSGRAPENDHSSAVWRTLLTNLQTDIKSYTVSLWLLGLLAKIKV